MAKCTNCQSTVGENDSSCPSCGAVFEDSIEEQSVNDNISTGSITTNYIAICLISAMILFVSMTTSPPGIEVPGPARRPMYYLPYIVGIVLWIAATIGMVKRDKTGVFISKISVVIIAIFNISVSLNLLTRYSLRRPGTILPPLDPISSLIGIISVSGPRGMLVPRIILNFAPIIGSILVIGIAVHIHRNEQIIIDG